MSGTTDSSAEPTGSPREYFATTHWTAVIQAGERGSPGAREALEELCRAYWYPLYAYVRRRGCSHEDAEDLTQGFFAAFLGKNHLQGLDSGKGRFRAFLLASLKHFLANEWRKANRQKRGGGVTPLSLDWSDAETRYQEIPSDSLGPDQLYDQTWAVTLLKKVIDRLRDENAAQEKEKLFERLKPFLVAGKELPSYSEVAAAFGMTEEAVRVAVHRLRREYRELLRHEIAQTLSDPAQVDDEIRSLFSAFAS